MRIRVKCPATGRIFSAEAMQIGGRMCWISTEGANLGVVGMPISPYKIMHVIEGRRRE